MSRLSRFSGLKWVGSELDEVIRKARDALEEYVEGGGEANVLGPCVEQLIQVRGVLEMLQLRGAGRLAEEMQVSARALKEGRAAVPREAAEALMLAMIQLPDYLEKLESGGDDIPLVLLPAINDLRASRGVQPLSEADFVVSGITPEPERKVADEQAIKNLLTIAHRARPRLHKGMLDWFRGTAPEAGLKSLRDVFSELEENSAGDTVLRGLFRAAHAMIEGLLDQSIETDNEVKGLVGRVDRIIKQLGAKGVPSGHEAIPQDVLKELLYHVSRADSPHPTIQSVKAEYDLERAFPSEDELADARQRMLAPNAGTLAGMRSAVVKELLPIKDTLDLYMRGSREQTSQLLGLEAPMLRLAKTLDMVGLGDLSQRLHGRAGDIKSIASGEAPVADVLLMGIASDLLYVESSLENVQREARGDTEAVSGASAELSRGEMQSLVNRTLEQAAVEMAKAKEAIVAYMGSHADTRLLQPTPGMFHRVAGVLRVIARNEAADVVDQIRDFIQQVLITGGVAPEQRVLDSLAEAITGIEYYMEAVGEGRRDTEQILNIARAAFVRLEQSSKVEDEVRLPATEQVALPQAEVSKAAVQVAPLPMVDAAEKLAGAEELAATTVPSMADIDPEILEIFLEEAREEEPVVQECFRRWRDTPEDSEALATLRRSFHTLKGSGRLVGALVIGDFSWSVENLLNRVIDQTIEPSSDITNFLQQAVAVLPELVNAQDESRAAKVDTAALMARADELAGKRSAVPAAPGEAVPEVEVETDSEQPVVSEGLESGFVIEDSELAAIFEAEAREHLETLYAFLAGCEQQPLPCGFQDELVRSLHTLAGSSRMIGLDPLAVVAKALEVKASPSPEQGLGADAEFLGYLKEGADAILAMVDALQEPGTELPETDALVARIQGYVPGRAPTAPAPEEQVALAPIASGELPFAVEGGEEEITLEGLDEPAFLVEAPEEEEIFLEGLEQVEPPAEAPEEAIYLGGLEEGEPAVETREEEISLEGLEEVASIFEAPEEEISLEGLEEVAPIFEAPEEEISFEGLEEVAPSAEAPAQEISLEGLEEVAPSAEAPEEEISFEGLEEVAPSAEAPAQEISLEGLEEVAPIAEAPAQEISLEGLKEVAPIAEALEEEASLAGLDELAPAAEASEEEIYLKDAVERESAADTLEKKGVFLEREVETALAGEDPEEVETLSEAEEEIPAVAAEALEAFGGGALEGAEEAGSTFEEISADPELVEIFLEEAEELLDNLDGGLHDWQLAPDDSGIPNRLQRTLHTLKGGARLTGIQSVGNLSHALETLVSSIGKKELGGDPQAQLSLFQRATDALSKQLDAVRNGQPVSMAERLIQMLHQSTALPEAAAQELVEIAAVPSAAPRQEETELVTSDRELVEVFLEEAQELLDQLDNGLRDWENNPDDKVAPVQLNRNLHTLKGGARMAGIQSIGDLSHALETLLSGVTADGVRSHPMLMPLAQQALDGLSEQIESVRQERPVQRAANLVADLESMHREVTEAAEPDEPEAAASGRAEEETVISLRKVVAPEAVPSAVTQTVQERVRVRSDLLNRLVNNSGEISIYRARLEQQNTVLGFNLGELEQTVSRLHNQLRQMEIETEAQILYRFDQEHEEGMPPEEDLDPLEMDRFSTIQQLSRSLIETVNDLVSIKNLLYEQQKEAGTLLLQHSRISNDLQDGLLRTRMVPFTQLVPRLRRVVRQTANSLGKRAVLEVFGGEGEMDRSILDRMLAPMEHILRNAVSHGIEPPERRRAAGKMETGKVSIYLTREGNDVIITVSDDGAGLNLDAIRRRAVETGLLESSTRIDDDDLMQLVLEPGFSTTKEVTQISGRGVGTDVVVSEVKQMGGSLEIDSQPARGTSFAIRLPFTLAISESLLVELGDDIFAVPHPTMEGVVRISADDLAKSYDGTTPYFSYAGHNYKVRYLGGLLGTAAVSRPEGRKWLPLLLVRSGEHRVAIQVDRILGNRPVVVKSVGPQLSTVRWISGGTILPDGRVALILDVSALVRMDAVHTMQVEEDGVSVAEERSTRVMVVDDSITVRKVTTRLLKRHNMVVSTAKDGVDAVTRLQEEHPDVMLLDIEMPRMDGYELARHMRNSVELRDIPIIMITSRSGEKHRNIALSLGVRRYLGKPYQEADLLDNIYAVLAEAEVEAEA